MRNGHDHKERFLATAGPRHDCRVFQTDCLPLHNTDHVFRQLPGRELSQEQSIPQLMYTAAKT